ncbi:MAG: hypothetical protein SGILL_006832 [Bacillariaceae sp.]
MAQPKQQGRTQQKPPSQTMAQPGPTLWEALDVPLPPLKYENTTTAGQGKGSTNWAAHSHTPISVAEWTDFDSLVVAEGQKDANKTIATINLGSELSTTARRAAVVSEEEHVTQRLNSMLGIVAFEGFTGDTVFNTRSNELTAEPDIIAMKQDNEGLGVGDTDEYQSPGKGQKASIRRATVALVRKLLVFPFETKPVWKFAFVNQAQAHTRIINEWEIPDDFDKEKMNAHAPLPEVWSAEKVKVFHLVRQVYGQMVSDKCKYGIFHVYEMWFFLKRNEAGDLFFSRGFGKTETSPSVLQAIKTLIGFGDHAMMPTSVHPKSASKVRANKKAKSSKKPDMPGGGYGSSNSDKGRGSGGNNKNAYGSIDSGNVAATLLPWDCEVYDSTGNVLLMTTRKNPSLLVKLQRASRMRHVADEMANEATVYTALAENEAVQCGIPNFFGYSTHLGVGMICIGREMDDFEDIGIENLSKELKLSAVRAASLLSDAGVLHNDLELRNIVQSRADPCCAKIIDFGRAVFSTDTNLLRKQVERVKILLGLQSLATVGMVNDNIGEALKE